MEERMKTEVEGRLKDILSRHESVVAPIRSLKAEFERVYDAALSHVPLLAKAFGLLNSLSEGCIAPSWETR